MTSRDFYLASLVSLFFGWREAHLGVLFLRIPKSFRQVTRGGFMMGGRRLSTKTLHRSQEGAKFMTLRYPMGNGKRGQKTTAFWGKQKNFNIFFFS